jgi:Ca-activated chloride channel family protein
VQAVRESHATGYPVSVLGVGTAAGAPLPTGDGGFAEDNRGNIVIPQLNSPALRALAVAGGGRYAPLSTDDTDLNTLLASQFAMVNSKIQQSEQTTDRWREEGPWVVLLLVPLAALAFRRGWLLVLPLWVSLLTTAMPESAWALEWRNLWERQEQQAARALAEGNFPRAAELAQDPLRRGIAEYRRGHYQAALAAFSKAQGADADYNRGNTLTKLGRLEEAIAAYDAALAKQPNMEDAKVNRTVVENWLRQQQQRQQPQQAHSQPNTASQNPRQNRNEASQTSSAQQHQKQQPAEGRQSDAQDHQNQANTAQYGDAQRQPPDRQPRTDGFQQSNNLPDPLQDSAQTNPAHVAKQQHPQETTDSTDRQQQATAQASDIHQNKDNSQKSSQSITATTEPFNTEEQQAIEQWLRRIPDDPGGLLRRKFLYQYQQRDAQPDAVIDRDW